MSKSQELIAKQHPISAGDILGMVAGLAAAAIHIYETEPSGKLSQLFALEGIPPTYQLIKPIVQESKQLIEAGDAEADDFLKFVTAVISLLDKASEKANELGLSEAAPPTIQ
ncbi:hypothetical protein [Eikenella corrodens]|uniref:hypothetical protein n=2 Tax=Eikenella corrodens TaxID=539 RepID=UPI000B4C52FA|nr:hypothetical protein [Eikenella corrodens]OWP27187.1 hypothetical protein CA838_02515 [Eikenella corrodens]DAY18181.1 MAG TPA: hypothetical protein [Caudoviricetes sp.]